MQTSSLEKSKYGTLRQWFQAARDSGEFIGIRFGHLPVGSSEPDWLYYPHSDYDGIGAFAEILRTRGAELKQLPQIKYYPAYSAIVAALKHWPRYALPRRPLALKPLGPTEATPRHTEPPNAAAWHLFDEETTQRIRLESRKNGYTVNTLLLRALTEAIRPFLLDKEARIPWMVPVNMRGGVNQFRDSDNHSSYVTVDVGAHESAFAVHHKILKALSRGQHWGNWHAFKLAKITTHRMRIALVTRGMCISQWNIGAFSNLGEWDSDRKITNPRVTGDWLFAPPTLRTQMIAAGCITFQGRLSLTIQTHPELTTSMAVVSAWMRGWEAEVQRMINSPAPAGGIPRRGVFRDEMPSGRAQKTPLEPVV